MSDTKYKITVLLPTRGRTTALQRSVSSLIKTCSSTKNWQIIFAFDDDDAIGTEYFTDHLSKDLDRQKINYTAMSFAPMTYGGLNVYYNSMAENIDTDWFFVWNDDAIMDTQDWDQVIIGHTGQFRILKVHTHGEHPYSIFPIVPKSWYDLLGYFSRHQMIDAELSQNAYLLDVIEIVDINVTHDRADLTGNNKDETDRVRVRFEGNPTDPRDFHNRLMRERRFQDCERLYEHMKQQGLDVSWYEAAKAGKQDAWAKMHANDINKQMTTILVQ